ncbi:MobF family relaxase [Streptomyces sp. NPDC048172]|uniref:MobF family relaxase n=1 Tax=Streptomyces sp. NPDC048172 TaxID=3365505 RepID=UPI003713D3B2
MIGSSDAQVEYRLTGGHGCATVAALAAEPLVAAIEAKADAESVGVAELLGSRAAKRTFFAARTRLRAGRGEVTVTTEDAVLLLGAAGLAATDVYPGVPLLPPRADAQLDYHLDANERPLVWIGNGLTEFGIEPGSVLTAADFDAARRLMRGEDPRDGSVLVEPKLAIAPEAKLPTAPLVKTLRRMAAARGIAPDGLFPSQRSKDLFGRVERQVARYGQSHRAPVSGLLRLAEAAGADALSLYGRDEVERALRVEEGGRLDVRPLLKALAAKAQRERRPIAALFASEAHRRRVQQCWNQSLRRPRELPIPVREALALAKGVGLDPYGIWDEEEVKAALRQGRVEVGNRGADVTLELPKSYSVLLAFAAKGMAAETEAIYTSCGRETVAAMERWTAYAMRGRHGDGASAERVSTSGFSGWMMVHRAARPVDGAACGDPHFHLHFTLANLVKGADGKWSTVAAGGRDLHRHARATQALMSARIRHDLHARYGLSFRRDERTGAWEIEGIPERSIRLFAKRDSQIRSLLQQLGVSYETATTAARIRAGNVTRAAKNHEAASVEDDVLRRYWQAEARASGEDPQAIAEDLLRTSDTNRRPSTEALCRAVFDPAEGLTAHSKEFTHAAAIAAVLDAMPYGVASAGEAEDLTDAVLAHAGYAVQLLPKGPQHFTHPERYTTADVIDAETTNLTQALNRRNEHAAVVPHTTLQAAVSATEAAQGPGFAFSAEQRAVLHRILTAGHGIDAVIGIAGAGKTTLMDTARQAWQASGHVVAGASTAAVACANLTAETGIPARTLASWMTSVRDGGQGLAGIDVLVLDEAAMCDDRDLADLLTHAQTTGTKVVGIGDPQQLHSPGIGGSFAAIHDLLDGLSLTENYRQRDPVERRALALWRAGDRAEALHSLARYGRVHAEDDKDATIAAMLTAWHERRSRFEDDHEAVQQLVMLAATNAIVDELNLGARALRRHHGNLTSEDHHFPLTGGGTLTLAVGDQVLVRANDYRARATDGAHADVLNGYRGLVRAIDPSRGVLVEWRRKAPTGGEQEPREWVTSDFIAEGGLSLGYAMTGHKAQGLTVDHALVYGPGALANALYTMLSRDRQETHLYLPLAAFEADADRARNGEAATGAERLDWAVAGLLHGIERGAQETLVLPELPGHRIPSHVRATVERLSGDTDHGATAHHHDASTSATKRVADHPAPCKARRDFTAPAAKTPTR